MTAAASQLQSSRPPQARVVLWLLVLLSLAFEVMCYNCHRLIIVASIIILNVGINMYAHVYTYMY